jgi:hypothetical protein
MGNNNFRPIKSEAVFRQSLYDFPCPVSLGKYTPSFGLHRYKQGLRFVPSDDEGFTLKGDKQRLLYKGRRRSHRFTILGDCSFEYDCILNREPESNVISLRMEGAENFDFFRQPNYVEEPFLKGSYAVYKKETLVGEGTGKLCHIHRPEVIDARGRRCWGELSVVGNELRITIPEYWLDEAKYPVVVDPTVGTTTIGSQTTGPNPFPINVVTYDRPTLDSEYALNKYLVPQTGNGLCNAYVYCYDDYCDWDFLPCLYTHANNKPYARKSQNENIIDVTVYPPRWPVGWKTNTFQINGSITAGDYVWFGGWAHYFWTRFDYGGDCYKGQFSDLYEDYLEEYGLDPYIVFHSWVVHCDIIWSWYFNYAASGGQSYVRTLTQGVSLPDNRIITGNYKRNLSQTAGNSTSLNRLPLFVRNVAEIVKAAMSGSNSRSITRQCAENVNANSETDRNFSAVRKAQDILNVTDIQAFTFFYIRSVPDTVQAEHNIRHSRGFFRGLLDYAGSIAETACEAGYYRTNADTVKATGTVFRGLLIFARIVTKVFIRDYLLGRFLKSKAELSLKSCICREIVLESRIQE